MEHITVALLQTFISLTDFNKKESKFINCFYIFMNYLQRRQQNLLQSAFPEKLQQRHSTEAKGLKRTQQGGASI